MYLGSEVCKLVDDADIPNPVATDVVCGAKLPVICR